VMIERDLKLREVDSFLRTITDGEIRGKGDQLRKSRSRVQKHCLPDRLG
jgi:hypothetical protein